MIPVGFHRAPLEGELAEGEGRALVIAGVDVLLCRTREGYFAVANRCSHQMSPLAGGKIRGCYIFCPLHGARFDLRDGKPIGQITDKYLTTFDLRLANGAVYINPTAHRPVGAPS